MGGYEHSLGPHGEHIGQQVTFVQLEEMCRFGSSPIVDFLIRTQRVHLDVQSQTIKVEWLWKIKIGNHAFQTGDFVLCSTAGSRYIALILSMLHIAETSFVQMYLVANAPTLPLPPVTWSDIKEARLASVDQSVFAELASIDLALLHPVAGRSSERAPVRFLSW